MKSNHTFADGNTASILDNLNTAVFRTNLEGSASIIDVNPAFIKMFGYKDKTEIESISLVEFYLNPADRIEMWNELKSSGNIRNRELIFKRKDGSVFTGRVSSVLVKDSEERVSLLMALLMIFRNSKPRKWNCWQSRGCSLVDLLF